MVSLLHLTDSVFVWCGQSEYGIDQMLAGSNTAAAAAAAADKNAVEAAAMEEEALASLSEEDRRQLQVEREADAQLEQAMREAGRSGDGDGASLDAIRSAPKGLLARHWGMAMQGRSGKVSDGGVQVLLDNSNGALYGPEPDYTSPILVFNQPPAKSALFRTSSDLATPIAGRLGESSTGPNHDRTTGWT